MSHERYPLRSAVMLIAVLVFVSAIAQVRPSAQNRAAACPLTDAQTSKSIDAFARIAHFLTTEPRCFNCHGGVNPHIDGTGLDPDDPTAPASKVEHGGKLIVRQRPTNGPNGTPEIESECSDCHNHMADRSGGGHSVWMTAPSFLSFVDKDATTLCRQIKRETHTAEHFLGHLEDDNGGNAFAKTAFIGNRGLDPDRYPEIIAEPPSIKEPSIKHPAVMQLARNWVAAMGGSFKGDESCGCEFKHAKWSGQIHITFDSSGGSSSEQVSWSRRQFSQITLTFKDGVGTAAGHAEVQMNSQMLRGVVDNGNRHYIKDSADDTQGSGSQSVPATVEVAFHPNGEYSIQPAWTPQPVGKSSTVSCRYSRDGAADCMTTGLPLYAETYQAGWLTAKTSDPNHVVGSKSEGHYDMVGDKQVGETMRVVTWDLWRSN